jgi:hypothetical protein
MSLSRKIARISNCLFCPAEAAPEQSARSMKKMTRTELEELWKRSKSDPKFRRLLLAMLAALVWVPSTTKDRLAVCALADFTLRKAGAVGRRDLKRRLAQRGVVGHLV